MVNTSQLRYHRPQLGHPSFGPPKRPAIPQCSIYYTHNKESGNRLLSKEEPFQLEAVNNVYERLNIDPTIWYLHGAASFPVKSTWLKAIHNGNPSKKKCRSGPYEDNAKDCGSPIIVMRRVISNYVTGEKNTASHKTWPLQARMRKKTRRIMRGNTISL